MAYYEQLAEGKRYAYFKRHCHPNTSAHFHSAVEFLFVEKGQQEVLVNGERRWLFEGEGCFCDSFQPHAYPFTKAAESTIIVCNKSCFDRLFLLFDNKIPPSFFHFDNFSLLKQLHALYTQNPQNNDGRYAIFEGIIGILVGEISKNVPFVHREQKRHETLICDILRYAEDNLCEDLSLHALSDKFGYTREHISRLLHKYLLENWTSYLNRLRVRVAHTKLQADTTASVLEIAFSCGFESANTFYRSYKKEFSHPPRSPKISIFDINKA